MATPLTSSMPRDIELGGGFVLRITAADPSTGAVVSGVNVSKLVVAVSNVGAAPVDNLAVGPYLLVPGEGA